MKVDIITNKENSSEEDIFNRKASIESSIKNIPELSNIKNDLEIEAITPNVDIFNEAETEIKINPKMRRTSFQARLGKRLDKISQKIIDNQIRLTSHPTDMIRIKVDRDPRSQDLLSRTITSAEILPIILPPMKDIPMRRLIRENNQSTLIPSLYPTAETTYYELYAPLEVKLDEDDLLLRIMEDSGSDDVYVLCLQIKEILGTLGYSSIRYQKFWASIYDEQLPPQIIKILKEATKKREELGW